MAKAALRDLSLQGDADTAARNLTLPSDMDPPTSGREEDSDSSQDVGCIVLHSALHSATVRLSFWP